MEQTNRVLLVDDSPINLRIIERQLQRLGLFVTTASSGREALEKLTSMEYDAVFMDHLMPEMDGIETLHAIRSMEGEYYRNIPVVVLTANEAGQARERFLAEGFDEFLQKPTTAESLGEIVKCVIETKSEDGEENGTSEVNSGSWEYWERKLLAAGLDVKTALLYCGGETSYVDIVQYYCKASKRTEQELTQAVEREDWENYTIVVHGIKSGLRSIGATALSEEARKLETAGRTGDTAYIPEHHEMFIRNYRELLKMLSEDAADTGRGEQKSRGTTEGLRALSEAEFQKIVDEAEDAAYDMDGSRLTEILNSLNGCCYKDAVLSEAVEAVRMKMEKADYLSAVDVIRQWK